MNSVPTPTPAPEEKPAPRFKFVVIDCETNGLPDYTKPADDPCQPRLASLGVVMLNDEGKTEAEHEWLVKPEGWKMTEGASAVNGLTDERLEAEGLTISDVLSKYRTLIEAGYVVAAYGAQHDCKIMRGEFRRRGLPDLFEETRNVCLMRACQPLRIPKANGKGGWPQLADACRFFGLEPEPMPHTALAGAQRAAGVLRALAAKGMLPAPEVHYAKESPTKPAPAKIDEPQPPPIAKRPAKEGDTKTEGGVDLIHNRRQFVPVVNRKNYPNLFNTDGSRKE